MARFDKTLTTAWCLMTMLVVTIATPLHAGGAISMEVVSAWGGPVNAVQIVGDVAFVAAGQRVVALDISDLSHVTEIGSVNMIGTVADLALMTSGYVLAAVTGFPGQSSVVDVSDPSAMSIVWQGTGGVEVDIHDNTAYLQNSDGSGELWVFDITEPTSLVYLGNLIAPGEGGANFYDSVIIGDRLYVGTIEHGTGVPSDTGAGMRIYDLSGGDLLNPALLGSILLVPGSIESSQIHGIAVEGDYAYVILSGAINGFRVLVVDVSNPVTPLVVGTFQGFREPTDIAVSGGYVYVADWAGSATPSAWSLAKGLVVLDVSNPALPTEVATFETHGTIRGVRVVGNRAYLFDDGEGLIVMDVSSPTNPIRLGNYHSPAYLRKMAKAGELLYVVDQWNGFTVLDVSDPHSTPVLVGVYQTPFGPSGENMGIDNWAVAVQGNVAYFTAGFAGLQAVDVSDLSQPAFISAAPPPAGFAAKGLAMMGNIAHAGMEKFSPPTPWIFRNYDVSDPQFIGVAGSLSLQAMGIQCAKTIAVNPQGIAFTARDYERPQRIDTGAGGRFPYQNPAYLSPPGGNTLPGVNNYRPRDCALNGDYWYIINLGVPSQGGGLYVKDVSDPLNPVDVDYIPLATVGGIAHQNGRLYVMTGNGILRIFDVATNPGSPVQLSAAPLGFVGTGANWVHLLVEEPYVYVSSGESISNNDVSLMVMKVNGLPAGNPADLNGDGVVNSLDLGILLSGWSIPPSAPACGGSLPCPADINHDGVVNSLDLGILLSSWTLL